MPRVINPNDKRLRANRQAPAVRSAMLMADARNSRQETSETYHDAEATSNDNAPIVKHGKYGQFPVYKLTARGCTRISVNAQSLAEVLSQPHYSDVCFDCGKADCLYSTEIRGELPTNKCDGKPSRMARICPEPSCRKRIMDTKPTGAFLEEDFGVVSATDDPNVIGNDDLTSGSSPETRTRSALEIHIIGFHSDLARELGLGVTPQLPRLAVV